PAATSLTRQRAARISDSSWMTCVLSVAPLCSLIGGPGAGSGRGGAREARHFDLDRSRRHVFDPRAPARVALAFADLAGGEHQTIFLVREDVVFLVLELELDPVLETEHARSGPAVFGLHHEEVFGPGISGRGLVPGCVRLGGAVV